MGQILKATEDNTPLNKHGNMNIPAWLIPSFRTHYALENKIDKKFLIRSFGGLGDQVCAEPSIRYAIKNFKDCEISVESLTPELFGHLPLKDNFHEYQLTHEDRDKYFCFQSMYDTQHLSWEFLCHMIVNCVDFCSLNMWRCNLPIKERHIVLLPKEEQLNWAFLNIDPTRDVVIHPGRNWPSKTFPKWFWDDVINYIIKKGGRPVLIGADVLQGRGGTVDVNPQLCLDLRGKLSVMGTVAVLQRAKVLLTNDSAPLHLAASGDAWIGFCSTVKHPDFITHWRRTDHGSDSVEWSWRMKDFASGGLYESINLNPNHTREIFFDKVEQAQLESWLPNPAEYASWAIERLRR